MTLARALIQERMAGCVNIMAECTSVYRWQDQMENATEVPVFIKTLVQHYAGLEQLIKSLHPYELPEIVAVPISNGLPAYLKWIAVEILSSDN